MSDSELVSQSSYILKCLSCNTEFHDEYQLMCTANGCTALLRTEYPDEEFKLEENEGLFRFINWLPVENSIQTKAGPVTFQSEELNKRLGLPNLYISFNGYYPERGAYSQACSFKEYEAYPTLQRMKERRQGVVQVSSAGNTARAFAIASEKVDQKVVLTVPTHSLSRVWTLNTNHENILLFAVDGDYFDAITFGRALVAANEELLPEGGARNVARRDGMGLTLLNATLKIGRLPDYYFQGIGSGTGGIAAYETALKLIKDGKYGDQVPKFMLSQNIPFTPMVKAWRAGRRTIIEAEDMPDAKNAIDTIYAKLLSNRVPPYSIEGGVFDILTKSNGDMLDVTNDEAKQAFELFEEIEQIDIDPAAAVALASLIKANEDNKIDAETTILLNISGGGYKRIEKDKKIHHVKPAMTISSNDFSQLPKEALKLLETFLK